MILSSFPSFIKHLVHNTINFDYENDNWINWEHSDYNKNKISPVQRPVSTKKVLSCNDDDEDDITSCR